MNVIPPTIFILFKIAFHLLISLPSFTKMSIEDFSDFPRKTYSACSPVSNTASDAVIVFVHGRNSNSEQFKKVIQYLERQSEESNLSNFTTLNSKKYHLIPINLGPTAYTTFIEDADTLTSILQAITQPIILIGVSKGGVICMEFASRNDERIKAVVTISSPLKGTLATFPFEYLPESYNVVANEFKYRGDVVTKLQNKVEKGYKGSIFHVVPTYDHLIVPSSSSYYESTPSSCIYEYKGYDNHCLIQNNDEVLVFLNNVIQKVDVSY